MKFLLQPNISSQPFGGSNIPHSPHKLTPDTFTQTTLKEQMVMSLLMRMAEETENIARIAPFTQMISSGKSIMKS
jgi:hypothetical protein